MLAGHRVRCWSGSQERERVQKISCPMGNSRRDGTRRKKKVEHRETPVFDRKTREETHRGGIYGHSVKWIRRRGEATKAVLWSTVRVVVIAVVVVAVVPSRRIVFLAATGAEDAAYDGSDNHNDGNWDTKLEPVPLRAPSRACA